MRDDLLRKYLLEENSDFEARRTHEERFGSALVAFVLFCACVLLIYELFYNQ